MGPDSLPLIAVVHVGLIAEEARDRRAAFALACVLEAAGQHASVLCSGDGGDLPERLRAIAPSASWSDLEPGDGVAVAIARADAWFATAGCSVAAVFGDDERALGFALACVKRSLPLVRPAAGGCGTGVSTARLRRRGAIEQSADLLLCASAADCERLRQDGICRAALPCGGLLGGVDEGTGGKALAEFTAQWQAVADAIAGLARSAP